MLLPIVCLVADPIVFRSSSHDSPKLPKHALFAYTAIGLAFLALSLWLLCRRPASLLAGLLLGESFFALVLGLILFPASLTRWRPSWFWPGVARILPVSYRIRLLAECSAGMGQGSGT
jgi:hypothetical protein